MVYLFLGFTFITQSGYCHRYTHLTSIVIYCNAIITLGLDAIRINISNLIPRNHVDQKIPRPVQTNLQSNPIIMFKNPKTDPLPPNSVFMRSGRGCNNIFGCTTDPPGQSKLEQP